MLSNIDLFASLDHETISWLAESGVTIRTRPGASIIRQGDLDTGLRAILSGSASVRIDGNDRGIIGPGDCVGEVSLIDNQPPSASLAAGPDGATTFALSATAFESLLDRDPQITRTLLKNLCAQLRRAETKADG